MSYHTYDTHTRFFLFNFFKKKKFMNHFEMTYDELTERIQQFERQYYSTILTKIDISYEEQVYLDYIEKEIEQIKSILLFKKVNLN
jgi:uncharacterized membrane protein